MKKLDQLKETYKKLGEEIKELENPKIDFSKWIGRSGTLLCIRGENQLVAFSDGDILYANNNRYCSDDKINYEHTTLDKLERGDVFICEDYLSNITLSLVRIYQGRFNDGTFITQYIKKGSGIEYISHYFYTIGSTKVIKFLRN